MARKVAFFTFGVNYGGDDTVLIQLLRHWPSSEDQRTLFINAGHPGLDAYRREVGQAVRIVPLEQEVGSFADLFLRPLISLRALLNFRRLLAELGPDVLWLSSGGFPLSATSWCFLGAARFAGIRRIYLILHNSPHWGCRPIRAAFLRLLSAPAPGLCRKAVTVSKACARDLAPYFGNHGKLSVIYNGIELRTDKKDLDSKLRDLGNPSGKLIGAISNFEMRKGFRFLVMAMPRILAEFPEASLVIIGAKADPVCHAEILGLIRELKIGARVFLPGYLPDAGQYAECFDVCVIPSIYHESFGLMALEAMQYRKPVVATEVGGLPEVVLEGIGGILVPPESPEILADAVLTLLRSPDLAREMGEAGYRTLRETFTAETMARNYFDLTGA